MNILAYLIFVPLIASCQQVKKKTDLPDLGKLAKNLSVPKKSQQRERVELAWTNRQLRAAERLKKISVKNGNSKGANLSKQDWCDLQLARAYMINTLSKKKHIGSNLVYSLLFHADGKNLVQINLAYTKDSQVPTVFNLVTLKNKSTVSMLPSNPNYLVIKHGQCETFLSLEKPLEAVTKPLPTTE